MTKSFGLIIREARKAKKYSQRDLAKLIGLDFTYLSKLENNRATYAPKEDVIRKLAMCLDLNAEELIFLAGRLPEQNEEFLKQNYKTMPVLFRRMQENPDFAREVFDAASKLDEESQI